ncbi:MAG: hypothetical protein SFV17_08405 [Candidatus Obscuribacter sp.]|nr:hypothetical protein [Candidatus Obscuribacter sp.]
MTAVIFIAIIALIGGGIYLWVQRQRKNAFKRHEKLVKDANLLDQAGNLTADALSGKNPSEPPTAAESTDDSATAHDGNVSNAAEGNTNKTGEAPNSAGKTAKPERTAPLSGMDATITRDALDIKELCEALLRSWRQVSETLRSYDRSRHELSSLHYTIEREGSLGRLKDAASAEPYFDQLVALWQSRTAQEALHRELQANLPKQARLAKADWQNLVQALKAFEEEAIAKHIENGNLSRQSAALVLTAHHLRSVSKSSIESALETAAEIEKSRSSSSSSSSAAAGTNDSSPPATAPENQELAEKAFARTLSRIKTGVVSACQAYIQARELLSKLTIEALYIERTAEKSVKRPQKPTPEEVMRYLAEIEDLEKEALGEERQAALTLAETRRQVSILENEAAALSTAIQAASQAREHQTGQKTDVLLKAAQQIHKELGEWREKTTAGCDRYLEKKWRSRQSTGNAPTAQEEEAIKALRAFNRTFGFAVAQATVAAAKERSLNAREPSSPNKPRIEREEDFGKALTGFDGFLKKQEAYRAEYHQWASQVEVVKTALLARIEKMKEAAKAMETRAAVDAKSVDNKSADELIITIAASLKMAKLHEEYLGRL